MPSPRMKNDFLDPEGIILGGGGERLERSGMRGHPYPSPPLPRGKDELKENIALLFQSREFSNSSDYHRPRFDPWTGGAD